MLMSVNYLFETQTDCTLSSAINKNVKNALKFIRMSKVK